MAGRAETRGADEQDYFQARDSRLGTARATDCALCQAPLPADHRYLCAACVAESGSRARALLDALQPTDSGATASASPASRAEMGDEDTECPNCGGPLDPSGRCAQCVITVRRGGMQAAFSPAPHSGPTTMSDAARAGVASACR